MTETLHETRQAELREALVRRVAVALSDPTLSEDLAMHPWGDTARRVTDAILADGKAAGALVRLHGVNLEHAEHAPAQFAGPIIGKIVTRQGVEISPRGVRIPPCEQYPEGLFIEHFAGGDATPGEGASPTGETSEPGPRERYTYLLGPCSGAWCKAERTYNVWASSPAEAVDQAHAYGRAVGWHVTDDDRGQTTYLCPKHANYDAGVEAERQRVLELIEQAKARLDDDSLSQRIQTGARPAPFWAPNVKAKTTLDSLSRRIMGERWWWTAGPGADRDRFRRDFQRLATSGIVSHGDFNTQVRDANLDALRKEAETPLEFAKPEYDYASSNEPTRLRRVLSWLAGR